MRAPALIYPSAERQPVVDELHGHQVADPYRWLEDPASDASIRWHAAQDELWQAHSARLPGRELLCAWISELADTGTDLPPQWRGDRQFFLRHTAGGQHPVLWTATGTEPAQVLIDPAELDPSRLSTLDGWQPDPRGELLAYQVSRRGTEQAELYVREVGNGRVLDGPIEGCRYSPVAWLPGSTAFYYLRSVDGAPPKVYLHQLGAPAESDVLILGADRPANTAYGLELSRDGRWLVLAASRAGEPGNDLWLADLHASPPEAPALRVVQQGQPVHTVCSIGTDGRMYVVTDADAPRGKLCVGDPDRPAGPWRTLVAQDAEAVLTNFLPLRGNRVIVARTRHTLSELTVHDADTSARLSAVPLPGAGTVGALSAGRDGSEVWFSYTDNVTPITVYRYDADTGKCSPVHREGGTFTGARPQTRQLVCRSADGTEVRMVVCAQPGGHGPRPTIVYGYGGFGTSLTPTFSSYALAWVRAGGVFVTANLRGGGEGGAEWHRAGMLENKQNTFDDFFAVAEFLIAEGWTSPDRLAITGESNGGLLVGAAITQRPELFAAAVCSAPVLDMVRYEQFGLGASWTGEFGSAADPRALGWLLGYSPYHHVRSDVDYPAVLFTVFDGDTRVDPMHARKMCAALQAATTSERPVLLRREADVGHGARAVHRATLMSADMLAFLAEQTGLDLEAAQ